MTAAELPAALATALARQAGRVTHRHQAATTGRLIQRYQSDVPAEPGKPILAGAGESHAYAAYRMPATYGAIRAVLDQLPGGIHPPQSHADLGGGTGAAVWALADRWPQLTDHTVWEQSAAAIQVGQDLCRDASTTPVRDATWRHTVLDSQTTPPAADVITMGYLLGELDPSLRRHLVDAAAAQTRQLLIVVEPGTKAGYARILDARERLITAGFHVVAPCPHASRCPLADHDRDWCHFAVRVNRSAAHRHIKGGELGYEDEKFSYLVISPQPAAKVPGRVLRHPRYAKGRVDLEVCQGSGTAQTVTIAKRDKELYRAARKTEWGDSWPPAE